MALRAFHANPSIGGFGAENSTPNLLRPNGRANSKGTGSRAQPAQNAGDAFCQIVKELVDNAVDAINSSLKNEELDHGGDTKKRIRVEIEPYENRYNGCTSNDSRGDAVSTQDLLQVTVLDNGCGMENIQNCVNAFQSSKGGSQHHSSSSVDKHKNTSGRYGIGLTLCLLHAQRLVPCSYACITSTKKGWEHLARALFVVDPEGDKVVCDKEELIPKQNGIESSGTCVRLLIPGGNASDMTWSRLVAYFNRFKLCPDISFGLEIRAPTLERIPIFIRPKPRISSSAAVTNICANNAKVRRGKTSNKTMFDEDSWKEGFGDSECDSESIHRDLDGDSSGLDVTPPNLAPETLARRIQIVEVAKAYWPKRKIVLKNVATSIHKIHLSDQESRSHSSGVSDELQLEVNMIVCPISAMNVSSDDFSTDENDRHSCTEQQLGSAEDKQATLELVRMVNDVPILDGAEAHSCGLVHGIENKTVWGSFGLDVSRTTAFHSQGDSTANGRCKWTPTFELRDHNQVSTYIQRDSNHKQLLSLVDEQTEESDSDDTDFEDWNSQDSQARKRKRSAKNQQELLPAGVRLHEVLVVVRIRAAPSSLPLPTLSKGRLPLNHGPIGAALHRGLNDCLRSLQSSNTALLLSRQNLQSSVRDLRYIPKLATEIALSVYESRNMAIQKYGKEILKLASRLNVSGANAKNFHDEQSCESSDTSTGNNTKVDTSLLERSIREVLSFKLKEKATALQASKKRMKKVGAASAASNTKEVAEDYEEIGCGELSSHESEGPSGHSRHLSVDETPQKQDVRSITASWSEFGDSPLPASKRPSDEVSVPTNDGSPPPIKEVEFNSGKGVPVYESDDPFDDDSVEFATW
ncbi:histidine kinase, DNA gyrase B-, and HSP90-like ATPase [Nitzschia inconspicua]|uniref:Histidine kinase, DNA gyrase B-, and HSP90-like ATPase n=1 Tax=Nitzschia inconspicua TaxID=303405 RepID=A0A9K3PQW4_9STRA|nr:histidine kinase, DNA gyrase B-, and HSP90-like ATPase [Nitzschia inconspicua]